MTLKRGDKEAIRKQISGLFFKFQIWKILVSNVII